MVSSPPMATATCRRIPWDEITDESGLSDIKLEMVDPGWKAEGYTIVNEMMDTEGKVPVHVIYPEGYDKNRAEKYPVIFYQAGGGVCYWELTDTSVDGVLAPANNPGCNYAFDNMLTGWAEAYPEAIVLSVDVHNTSEVVAAKEVAGVLDYFIANYNVDKDKIVGVGNSYGTFVVSDLIRQRPDLVSAFVENNGDLGNHANQAKIQQPWRVLIHTAGRCWTGGTNRTAFSGRGRSHIVQNISIDFDGKLLSCVQSLNHALVCRVTGRIDGSCNGYVVSGPQLLCHLFRQRCLYLTVHHRILLA